MPRSGVHHPAPSVDGAVAGPDQDLQDLPDGDGVGAIVRVTRA